MQDQAYDIAINVAIEWAEEGTSPYEWSNCPFGDIRYGLSDEDVQEAAEMLNTDPIVEFEEFIHSGLDDRSYFETVHALATIRSTLLRFRLAHPSTILDMRGILAAF